MMAPKDFTQLLSVKRETTERERQAVGTVPASIASVWQILTDGPVFGHLVHFGTWFEYDRRSAGVGTELKGTDVSAPRGRGGFSRYIVAWEPPTRLTVGLQPSPDTWVWDFSMQARGDETRVEYRCRYRNIGWWERTADSLAARLSGEPRLTDDRQQRTDAVIERLREECETRRRFGQQASGRIVTSRSD